MKLKPHMAVVLLAGFSFFCSPHRVLGQEHVDEQVLQEQVTTAIESAEAARRQAANAGSEWLQTSALIEDAREAAKNRQWQLALSLADKARQQGELAVEQATRESTAWRERVIH